MRMRNERMQMEWMRKLRRSKSRKRRMCLKASSDKEAAVLSG